MHLLLCFLLSGLIFAFQLITPAESQLSLEDTLPDIPEVAVQGRDFEVDKQTGLTTFRVDVHIPRDHHGYLDRGDEGLFIPLAFAFDPLEKRGFRVTEVSRPSGTRDDIVHATVLRNSGAFEFRLEAPDPTSPPVGTYSATLRHQICNDVTNICYPPKATTFPLHFAEVIADQDAPALANITQESAPALTVRERLTALFQRHFANFPVAVLLVFLAGLIASATPCVYPVIPITSAILMARGGGSRRLGQLNAVVYFLGITFFFTLLGIFAATTGTALSTLMTNAWVNLAFAGIFAYFGLSMIGFYEFQFLTPLIAKLDNTASRWDGFFGTFLMGATAGLVISPCVGPIAGAILLDITGQAAGTQFGNIGTAETALRGIGLMASFGMGLGIPFLVVGMLSNRLPQSGPWLTKVKFLLGIPILYIAYVYYLKGMETAAVPTNITHAILIGILAIALAVFLGLFHSLGNAPAQGQLVRRILGILLLIVGVHFLYNGLGQSGILIPAPGSGQQLAALRGLTQPEGGKIEKPAASQVEFSGNLRWLRDFPLAQERARTEGKPLFVDFYATWCANCKAFQRLAESNDQLNNALQQAVLVKIYDTDEIFETFQRDESYPELGGVGGQPFLPLFAIYSAQGALHWKGQDYRAIGTISSQLEVAKRIVVP